MTGDVHVVRKNNSRLLIANIVEDKIFSKHQNIFDDVNDVNCEVLRLIWKDSFSQRLDVEDTKPIIVADIICQLISVHHYRRCTVFIFHQKSELKERIIAYVFGHVFHNASSFGTSDSYILDDVQGNIIDHFIDDIRGRTWQVTVNKHHLQLQKYTDEHLRDIFGID